MTVFLYSTRLIKRARWWAWLCLKSPCWPTAKRWPRPATTVRVSKVNIRMFTLSVKSLQVWLYFCSSPLGETLVNVLDFKKDMGLWHGVLTVSLHGSMHWRTYKFRKSFHGLMWCICIWCLLFLPGTCRIKGHWFFSRLWWTEYTRSVFLTQ